MTMSVAVVLADAAARRPKHPAIIHQAGQVTYEQLWEQAGRYASALYDNGVRPGDRVAMRLEDGPQFAAVYFGILSAGGVVIPLNTTLKEAEIVHVLSDADARFLVSADSLTPQVCASAGTQNVVSMTVGQGTDTTVGLADAVQRVEPIGGPVARGRDDLAVVFYTSGTTGTPKGVMLTHGNIRYNVDRMIDTPYAFEGDDILFGCLPLAHSFGQICVMLTGFRAGISIAMMPRFSGREALEVMNVHRCTVFMGVPTMYVKLLDAAAQGAPIPRLDRAYCGGAPLADVTRSEFERVFGCQVYEGYGATETSCSVAYHYPGLPHRSGTTGVPINNLKVGVARPDVDSIDLLPTGDVGEIVVSGPTVMSGYLGLPDHSADVVVQGWFRTGDLGRLDADGYLSIVGRKKELILRGGYNVYPREIEEVLLRHPTVDQVAVIGVPNPVLGEDIWAIVVPSQPADIDTESGKEIIEWAKARLADYKYPRRVEFIEALPTGSSGKVLKRQLVSRYQSTVGI
jgi:long-chain acyl-CoA synthetase